MVWHRIPTHAVDPHPSEESRRALGERIDLTEQQVQVHCAPIFNCRCLSCHPYFIVHAITQAWFINRRRKEKKPEQVAPLSFVGVMPSTIAMATSPAMYVVPAIATQQLPAAVKKVAAPSVPRIPAAPGVHGAAFTAVMPIERNEDYTDLIEAAKHTIEGYREDGPVLGFVFDRPPMLSGSKRKNEADLGPFGDFHPSVGPIKVNLGYSMHDIQLDQESILEVYFLILLLDDLSGQSRGENPEVPERTREGGDEEDEGLREAADSSSERIEEGGAA